MLYVGGGAGMAPMRSHLYHLFRTLKLVEKLVSGMVEDLKENYFIQNTSKLWKEIFPNFKFYIALSEPLEEDNWKVKEGLDGEGDGFIGFVHQTVIIII